MNDVIEEPPYKSGRAAAEEMLKSVKEGACVDDHMQDQVSHLLRLTHTPQTQTCAHTRSWFY